MARKSQAPAASKAAPADTMKVDGDQAQVSRPRPDLDARALAPSENPDGRATGTATVMVALKYSTGLVLQGHKMAKHNEATPMGFKEVEKAVKVGEPCVINGTRGHRGSTRIEIVNGFALTPGVPKDLWDHWSENAENSALVRNGLIFADENPERVRAECRQRTGIRTNMEPISPPGNKPGEKLDPRLERGMQTYTREDETV